MESIEDAIMDREITPGLRLRMMLGKFRVIWLERGVTGVRFKLDFGNSVVITIDCEHPVDIQLNDLLTLYTEVPYANPRPPSQ